MVWRVRTFGGWYYWMDWPPRVGVTSLSTNAYAAAPWWSSFPLSLRERAGVRETASTDRGCGRADRRRNGEIAASLTPALSRSEKEAALSFGAAAVAGARLRRPIQGAYMLST